MSDIIKNLEKISSEYLSLYHDILNRIRELKEVPVAESLVGKCFKYRNGYSRFNNHCIYIQIINNKGYNLFTESFYDDKYANKIEFAYDKNQSVSTFLSPSYTPISKKQYLRAQKRLLNKLNERYLKGKNNK